MLVKSTNSSLPTNYYFAIPLSLQPGIKIFGIMKPRLFTVTEFIISQISQIKEKKQR